jgi:5-oxopent-3-ene-1,2,5-tricarboxylate decarboxylase/2-hydroxyhepta-2,4-diene-1,7-dioate isomerase
VFLKGPGSLVGHRGQTRRPAGAAFMHYECELAVVIGRHRASREACDAMAARRRLHRGQRLRDPRLPRELVPPEPAREEPRRRHALGPWLVDAADVPDPHALALRTYVNGELTQQGNTRDMVFDIPTLIEYLSAS